MKRSFRLPVVVTTLVVMGVILNIDGEDEEISMCFYSLYPLMYSTVNKNIQILIYPNCYNNNNIT